MSGGTLGCSQFLLFHYQQRLLAGQVPSATSRNLGETGLHTPPPLDQKHPNGEAGRRGQPLNAGPLGDNSVGLCHA